MENSSKSLVEIEIVVTESQIELARSMFREYGAWIKQDLSFQGFEDEVRTLPKKYARPEGCIFLAQVDGEAAGCVAMRPLGSGDCEIKRLFVKPSFQGLGIGRRLVEACLAEAVSLGYRRVLLDSLDWMTAAIGLYRSFGFVDCEAYNESPLAGVVYMEKWLALGSPSPPTPLP